MPKNCPESKEPSILPRRKWLAFLFLLPVFAILGWLFLPTDKYIFTRQIIPNAKTGERVGLYWYPHSEWIQMSCPVYIRLDNGPLRLLDDIEHEDAGGTAPVKLTRDGSALLAVTQVRDQTFGAAYIFKTRTVLKDEAAGLYLKAHPTLDGDLLSPPDSEPQPVRLQLSRWQLYRMGLPSRYLF